MEHTASPLTATTPVAANTVVDTIPVELFGVPRLLAGQRTLSVTGRTLAEVAAALGVACPALVDRVIDRDTGWLLDGYIFVADDQFTRDPSLPLTPDSSVLLVSSVAGGAT